MTREEWNELPPSIALAVLYDLVPGLGQTEAPRVPRPPKYDGRLSRKGGTYCWMSEMTLESLKYWHGLKSKPGDPKYAESDEKTAKNLAAWIAWRAVFPYETWSGTRGDNRATANPPSREPRLHEWDNSGRGKGSSGSRSEPQPAADDDEPIDEADIPF